MFEYWTHALSYVPTQDLRFFLGAMQRHRREPRGGFAAVTQGGAAQGADADPRRRAALTIRDIDDEVLIEKEHLWASRKPSKRALQLAFYTGMLTISERNGMLKTYELMDRHFGWEHAAQDPRARGDAGLSARPGAARAGRGEPGFDLPPRCRRASRPCGG